MRVRIGKVLHPSPASPACQPGMGGSRKQTAEAPSVSGSPEFTRRLAEFLRAVCAGGPATRRMPAVTARNRAAAGTAGKVKRAKGYRNWTMSSAFSVCVHVPPLRCFMSRGISPRMRSTSARNAWACRFCEENRREMALPLTSVPTLGAHGRARRANADNLRLTLRQVCQSKNPRRVQRQTRLAFRTNKAAAASTTRPGCLFTQSVAERTRTSTRSVACKATRTGCSSRPSAERWVAMRSSKRPRRRCSSFTRRFMANSRL